jgi:hypothetical protein
MQTTMTIQEVREAREEVERGILRMLQKLQADTGLCPTGIHIGSFKTYRTSTEFPQLILSSVRIELESI